MEKDENIYTLLDGRKLTGEELTEIHRHNKLNSIPPYARYFCSKCYYEVDYKTDGSFVCPNCEEIIM